MISGTVTLVSDQAVMIGHKPLHKGTVDLTGIAVGHNVDYEFDQPTETLTYIRKAMAPAQSTEHKTGGGKVVEISPTSIAYEFTWNGQTIKKPFTEFTDQARAKLGQFKIGDLVSVKYVGKICEDIEPKQNKFGGGGFKKPYDPAADEKRQRMIVRQSCLDRSVTLWLGCKPATCTNATENDLNTILKTAERFEGWVMRS